MAGLAAALDFQGVLDRDQDPPEPPLLDLLQDGPVADPRAGPDGLGEADAVEAVIDRHPEAPLEDLVREIEEGDEREQKEAVGDRAAQGAPRCPFRVDVDPLAVLGRRGESVDALLGDREPVGETHLPAGHGLELPQAQPVREYRHGLLAERLRYPDREVTR